MRKKKYNPEYIKKAEKSIWDILGNENSSSDYVKAILSIQDAVQAAANVWDIYSDEQKHQMMRFIREIALIAHKNIVHQTIIK